MQKTWRGRTSCNSKPSKAMSQSEPSMASIAGPANGMLEENNKSMDATLSGITVSHTHEWGPVDPLPAGKTIRDRFPGMVGLLRQLTIFKQYGVRRVRPQRCACTAHYH
eukprot:6346368-Karenia_brevis.AAC.1